MKFQILLILAITLLSAETKSLHIQGVNNNGHSYLNKSETWFDTDSPAINLRELISNEGTNSTRDDECDDPEACNYNPESEEDWDCNYPEDYGWCDCDGTYYDCAGECGGSDDSCTIMYPEEIGIYENNDCTGELITEIEGACIMDGEDSEGIINEQGCLDMGGFWLPGDTCYEVEVNYYANETDCLDSGGIFDPYYNVCFTITANEISTIDECCSAGGGTWDFEDEYCMEGEEQDYFWIRTEEIFDEDDGPPPLYFYDDLTWSEVCDNDCHLAEIPSQEECEDAGGNYDHWWGCDFDEDPSEADCEDAGGNYDHWWGCDFDEDPSEADCDSVGGEYNSWGFCHLGDDIPEDDCLSGGGEWHSWTECIFNEPPSAEECIDAGGWYDYGEDWCHITEENACNDLGGELNVDYYCYAPDMEVCDTLNGEWDGGSYCDVGEDADACNTLGGEWYEDSYCDIMGDPDICNTLGGEWYEEIECDIENEEVCSSLNGMWYEGICPAGTYSIVGDVFTLIFSGGGPGGGEFMGTIYFDTNGNWTGLEFVMPDWYDGSCIGFTFTSDPTMGIVEEIGLIPSAVSIQNIYPNPFNPVSTISFEVPEYGKVGITVYNLRGEQVVELMKGEYLNAGYHEIAWDASNYSSGIYFVTLRAGDKFQKRKITLLK